MAPTQIQTRPDRASGPAQDEFWAWCNKGELRLQRCTACSGLSCPPVDTCEHCGSTALAFERMSGRGRIVSWCSFEHDYYRGVLPIPYDTILVELEEGPLFISNPAGFGREDITFEMPVTLGFLDCQDSKGQFRLPVFGKA